MHIVYSYDLLSWSIKAACTSTRDLPSWASATLSLPTDTISATHIWNTMQEDNLCLFFRLDDDPLTILVAARNGIWKSIDELYLPHRKDEFREINDGDAQKLLANDEVWRRVCSEVQMFGITCRAFYHLSEREHQ